MASSLPHACKPHIIYSNKSLLIRHFASHWVLSVPRLEELCSWRSSEPPKQDHMVSFSCAYLPMTHLWWIPCSNCPSINNNKSNKSWVCFCIGVWEFFILHMSPLSDIFDLQIFCLHSHNAFQRANVLNFDEIQFIKCVFSGLVFWCCN